MKNLPNNINSNTNTFNRVESVKHPSPLQYYRIIIRSQFPRNSNQIHLTNSNPSGNREESPPPSRFPPRRGRRWKWKISGARKWKCPRLPGNNASKTMRRKFRKSKGPVAREGCIGGWVRASSIDSRRGISADYTRQPSKKKEGKEESGYGGRERVL